MTEKKNNLSFLSTGSNPDSFPSTAGSSPSSPKKALEERKQIFDENPVEAQENGEINSQGEPKVGLKWDTPKFDYTNAPGLIPFVPAICSDDEENDESDEYEYESDDDYANLMAEMEYGAMGQPKIYPDDIYYEQILDRLDPIPLFSKETMLDDVRATMIALSMANLQKKGEQSVDQLMITYNEMTNKTDAKVKDSKFEHFVDMVMEHLIQDPQKTQLVNKDKANFFQLDIFNDLLEYDLVTGNVITKPPTETLRQMAEEIELSLEHRDKRIEGKKAKAEQMMEAPKFKLQIMHGCNFLMRLMAITKNDKERIFWHDLKDVYDQMTTEKATADSRYLFERFKSILPLEEYPLMNAKTAKELFGRATLAKALAHPVFSNKVGFAKEEGKYLVFFKDKKVYSKEELATVELAVEAERQQNRSRNSFVPLPGKKNKKVEEKANTNVPIQLDDDEYSFPPAMTHDARKEGSPFSQQQQKERPEPSKMTQNGREEPQQAQKETEHGRTESSPSLQQQDVQVVSTEESRSSERKISASYQPAEQMQPAPIPSAQTVVQKKKVKSEIAYSDEEDNGDESDDEAEEFIPEPPRERKKTPPSQLLMSASPSSFFKPTKKNEINVKQTSSPWTQPYNPAGEKKSAAVPPAPTQPQVEVPVTSHPIIVAEADDTEPKTNIAPPETKHEKQERIEKFIAVQPTCPPNSKLPLTPAKTTDEIYDSEEGFPNSSSYSEVAPILPDMTMTGPLVPKPQMPHEMHPFHAKEKDEARLRQRRKMDEEEAARRANQTLLPGCQSSHKFTKDEEERTEAQRMDQRREMEAKKAEEEAHRMKELERQHREDEKRRQKKMEDLEREKKEEEERRKKADEARKLQERERMKEAAEEEKRKAARRAAEEEEQPRNNGRRSPDQSRRPANKEGKFGGSSSAFNRRTRGSEEDEEGFDRHSPLPNRGYPPVAPHNDRQPNYPPSNRQSQEEYRSLDAIPSSGRSSSSLNPQDEYRYVRPSPPLHRDARGPHPRDDWDRPPYENERDYYPSRNSQPSSRYGGPPSNYRENPMYDRPREAPRRDDYQVPPPPSFNRSPSSSARSTYSEMPPNRAPPPPQRSRLNERDDFILNQVADEIVSSEISRQRSEPHRIKPTDQFLNFLGSYLYAYKGDNEKMKWTNIRKGLTPPLDDPDSLFYPKSWMDVVMEELQHVTITKTRGAGEYLFVWD